MQTACVADARAIIWEHDACAALQIEGEFPQVLGIKESLIKYVFEPNAAKVCCLA